MTIKEIRKTVHLAWSPKSQDPIYLVAGTAAQQLDASFSTSAAVEVFKVNLGDPSKEPELKYAFKSDYRYVYFETIIISGSYIDLQIFICRKVSQIDLE